MNWQNTNKQQNKSQLEKILSNPFYYGYMMSKGALHKHIYEPLITKELFDKCQEVRFCRKKTKYKQTMIPFLYRSLLRCTHCNCAYSPELHKGKYVYMRPTKSQGECAYCFNIREEVITNQIQDVISKIYIPNDILEKIKSCLQEMTEQQKTHKIKEVNSLNKRYKILESMQNKALELLLANSITIDEYNPQVNKIKEEKLLIEEKVGELNKFDDGFQEQVVSVFYLANKSYELFKSSEVDDKRKIINLLFPNLKMEGKKLVFTLQKPFDKWIEFKDRPLWLPALDKFRTFTLEISQTMNAVLPFEKERVCA